VLPLLVLNNSDLSHPCPHALSQNHRANGGGCRGKPQPVQDTPQTNVGSLFPFPHANFSDTQLLVCALFLSFVCSALYARHLRRISCSHVSPLAGLPSVDICRDLRVLGRHLWAWHLTSLSRRLGRVSHATPPTTPPRPLQLAVSAHTRRVSVHGGCVSRWVPTTAAKLATLLVFVVAQA
jgi:hypothetical protein